MILQLKKKNMKFLVGATWYPQLPPPVGEREKREAGDRVRKKEQ